MLYEWTSSNTDLIRGLFESHKRFRVIMFAAMKQGRGQIIADSLSDPQVAMFTLSAISAIAGDSGSPAAGELIATFPQRHLLLTPNDDWKSLAESIWGGEFHALVRTSLSNENLDINHIRTLKKPLPEGFSLQRVNLRSVMNEDNKGLLMHIPMFFGTPENFIENGIGFCIKHEGRIVSMASTFTPFIDEFEIEIETIDKPEYRRKGFATIVAAALIEYALENGLSPHWDAQTKISVELAKKLGYTNPDPYEVYFRMKRPAPVEDV